MNLSCFVPLLILRSLWILDVLRPVSSWEPRRRLCSMCELDIDMNS